MFAVRFLRRNGDKIAKKQVVEAPRNRLKRVGGRPDLKFKETAKAMPKKKVPLAVSKKMAVDKIELSKVPLAVSKNGGGQDGTFESAASGVEKRWRSPL